MSQQARFKTVRVSFDHEVVDNPVLVCPNCGNHGYDNFLIRDERYVPLTLEEEPPKVLACNHYFTMIMCKACDANARIKEFVKF